MKLKPNTWYWFWDREAKGYTPGTELHEGGPPNFNYCGQVLTNKNGEILQPVLGEEFYFTGGTVDPPQSLVGEQPAEHVRPKKP